LTISNDKRITALVISLNTGPQMVNMYFNWRLWNAYCKCSNISITDVFVNASGLSRVFKDYS